MGEHDVRNVGVGGSNPLPSTKPSFRVVMITSESLTDYIRRAIPGAKVSVTDRTGTMDHFSIRVVSDLFKGKNLLDRHRLIYNALDEPMKDRRIHAVEIKAETTDGS